MPINGLSVETGSSNWTAMYNFYVPTFKALGYFLYHEKENSVVGFKHQNAHPEFRLLVGNVTQDPTDHKQARVGRIHVVIDAETPELVNRFYFAAVKAGGACSSPPAARSDLGYPYYTTKVLDPLGNSIETVYSNPPPGL